MAITAQQVKELREISGAGMMDCKKALEENGGDINAALEFLQKKGAAAAAKKAGRIAAEGLTEVGISADRKSGVVVEINSETDFVARNEQFRAFVDKITATISESGAETLEALAGVTVKGESLNVAEYTSQQIATIGEKLDVRRFKRLSVAQGFVTGYIHAGGQIAVLVAVETAEGVDQAKADEFGRDVAMHVAAMKPAYLTADEIPAEEAASYRDILMARALESGKPENIVSKIVDGQMAKWKAETSLLSQPFVKDSDLTVTQLQQKVGHVTLAAFARFEVGEGIEKVQKSLSDEVAEQLRNK